MEKKTLDNKIYNILKELKDNQIIDVKASKVQLDKLYYSKYNPNSNINIKKFDNIILVYGIIFKQGTSKPIRFDYHIFDYLNLKKDKIIEWISKYNKVIKYNKGESDDEVISTYDIFSLTVNDYNDNLIIKIDANSIDTFEHDEIHPYFIRHNNFIKFINNLDKICDLIHE
jgi:hypothetical protein